MSKNESDVHAKTAAHKTPMWVKLFVLFGVALVIAFAILHLTGNGMRHMHGGTQPADAPAPAPSTAQPGDVAR